MSELNWERACDWDLHAIVKGQPKVISNIMEMPPYYDNWLEEYYQNQEKATLFLDELQQICTPNYHNISSISSPQTLDTTIITNIDDKFVEFPRDESKQKIEDVSYTKNLGIAPKRRKNKHKKTLVKQAAGDRISTDKWNWRKYGEKVIKGSPYPRSYYRCSNSGGCLARKQVELSVTDPGKFLIAYIDDHNHPYPSRRPSQAGRTSRRFHASPPKIAVNNIVEHVDMSSTRMSCAMSQPITTKGDDRSTIECGREEFVIDDMDLICDNLGSYCDQFSFLWNVA